MSENESSLIKKPSPMRVGLKRGIAANRANFEQQIKTINPLKVENRLGIVMDDSGSMSGDPIQNAHKAIKAFTDSCNMLDTSIAIYPINRESQPLICDYDVLNLYVSTINATGGTELYSVLEKLIKDCPITRAVVFSDGDPTDSRLLGTDKLSWYNHKPEGYAKDVVKEYCEKEIPVDTIFIGESANSGYKEMEELARVTGGTFIHFQDSLSLASGLKYLAPKYRALLANPEIKAKIERGETV